MSHYIQGKKTGSSSNISTNRSILSNAVVVHPNGQQARIISTSSEDSAAGMGIQKLKIEYFTSVWEDKTEILTLNGTTPVDTIETDIYRIESFEAIKTGSNSVATGTITLKSLDGAQLFAQIDSGLSNFNRCLHYVKRGHRCQIDNIVCSSSTTNGVIIDLMITKDNTIYGGSFALCQEISVELRDDSITFPLSQMFMVDATDCSRALAIVVCVRGLAISQSATASFQYEDFHVKDINI